MIARPCRRTLLAAFGTALMAGCGFHPAYRRDASGRPGVASRDLAAIHVAVISDRPGQLLRQALQERFERDGVGGAPRFALEVSYSISGEGIAIQPDTTATRLRLTGRADWTLRQEAAPQPVLTRGLARSVDDINIFDQQYFAADLGNEAAQRRISETIADQITIQLAAYFLRAEKASAHPAAGHT